MNWIDSKSEIIHIKWKYNHFPRNLDSQMCTALISLEVRIQIFYVCFYTLSV